MQISHMPNVVPNGLMHSSAQQVSPMQPPQVPTPQPQPQPSPRPQPTPVMTAAPMKKKQGDVAASPAAPSTPAPSAATPTHVNSPSTPKSPKTKAKPKPTPKRKPSTVKAQPALGPSSSAPPASASTPASAATPSAVDQSSPAAATPESIGTKRRREEETTVALPAPSDAPSPKKARTDWDGPASAELTQKKEEVDSIQTEDDATKFIESMTEMLRMHSTTAGLSAEVSHALAEVISGCDPSSGDFGALGNFGPSSPAMSNLALGDGLEFFDFTRYSSAFDDDTGSKAVTPDLFQPTSAKPSPGSDSEREQMQVQTLSNVPDTATIVQPRSEDDPLRLGIWGEIDGGIGSYHQPGDGWKWDEPMPTSEHPWAIVSQP
jgi:hypothetical protein